MKNELKNRAELETLAYEQGAAAFGIADLNRLDDKDFSAAIPAGYFRAVVMGMRVLDSVLEEIVDKPTPLYFHVYRQLNYALDRLAFMVATRIESAGYRALPVPASQIVSKAPMRGQLSHKLLGWLAGIGFIGRNSLLVHPEYGARMRYVSVLTDMPLEPDAPYEGNCGECRACVAVCPAGAIHESVKDFDIDACYRKLCEFAKLPFIGQHVCGICVKACSGRRKNKRNGNP
jgi:epoxyqueuosine reductase QueG